MLFSVQQFNSFNAAGHFLYPLKTGGMFSGDIERDQWHEMG